MVRSSSGDNVIRYVLPVLSITSCFQIKALTEQNRTRLYVSSSSPGGGTGGKVAVYHCRLGRLLVLSFTKINVKKLQFIRIVNGDGSKTAKIIKRQC